MRSSNKILIELEATKKVISDFYDEGKYAHCMIASNKLLKLKEEYYLAVLKENEDYVSKLKSEIEEELA